MLQEEEDREQQPWTHQTAVHVGVWTSVSDQTFRQLRGVCEICWRHQITLLQVLQKKKILITLLVAEK